MREGERESVEGGGGRRWNISLVCPLQEVLSDQFVEKTLFIERVIKQTVGTVFVVAKTTVLKQCLIIDNLSCLMHLSMYCPHYHPTGLGRAFARFWIR